jgi:hypothetical protein
MKSRIFGFLLLSTLCGCSKETPPSAEQPRTAASPPKHEEAPTTPAAVTNAAEKNSDPAPAAAENASAKIDETNFALAFSSKGAYSAGKAGELEIVLEAKDPFHVNDKYPYKFKLADSPGVTYPDKVVTKDHVKLEHKKAVMTVAFTPSDAGKKKISGVFHFSVCTEDKCMIEKRDLALDVDVK